MINTGLYKRLYLVIILAIISVFPLLGQEALQERSPGQAGTQPEIFRLSPHGGIEGSEITLLGKNLGENLANVTVWFEKPTQKNGSHTYVKLPKPVIPVYLSTASYKNVGPDLSGEQLQELKFIVPVNLGLVGKYAMVNHIRVMLKVRGQTSNYLMLAVVGPHWKWLNALLALLLLLVLLGLLKLVFRGQKLREKLFIDSKTRTYSLAKCQAFAWTLVLIGSYFYLVVAKGLILGEGMIPDFNASLLVLMSISYGGLLGTQVVDSGKLKRRLATAPPRWSDLFLEGGVISIQQLQLVGFTVTVIIAYLYSLSGPDILSTGLPDIPATLLGLLGISQTAYLGGKAGGGRLVVNHIVPRKIQVGKKGKPLTLIGSGFSPNLKVLVQGHPQLLDIEFINNQSAVINPIPILKKVGWKQLMLVPPVGSILAIEEAIEVVDAKIETIKSLSQNPKRVELTLKGFAVEEVTAVIKDKPVEIVSTDNVGNRMILEAAENIVAGDTVKITSTDGELEAETRIPGSQKA